MSFEEFKNKLILRVRQEITRRNSDKIWGLVMEQEGDQCSIFLATDQRSAVHPLSIHQLYSYFLTHPTSMESLALYAVEFLLQETRKEGRSEFEKMKDKIYCKLINAERNREHLDKVPHRKFLDLAIVYRVLVSSNEETITASLIDNEVMEHFDVTEEELYEIAIQNTPRLFPSKFSITKMSANTMEDASVIIQSHRGAEGTTAFLYPDELNKVADALGSDLYLIPLSQDEVFAVRAEKDFNFPLVKKVIQHYQDSGRPERFLSNTIYYYSRWTERVYIAE